MEAGGASAGLDGDAQGLELWFLWLFVFFVVVWFFCLVVDVVMVVLVFLVFVWFWFFVGGLLFIYLFKTATDLA